MLNILLDNLPMLALILGLAVVVPAFNAGVAELKRRGVNTTVIEAVGRAAGAGYLQLVAKGQPLTQAGVLAVATAVGTDYLKARIPDTLKAAGIDTAAASAMVQAELGKLLAADASVSVVPAPAA